MIKNVIGSGVVKVAKWGLLTFALLCLLHTFLTGSPLPILRVEKLESPVAVLAWSEKGLSLADGRVFQIPGLIQLPRTSAALTEATERGIEINSNGRVYGLVRIHHWCGNDPVRKHLAKIDLAQMLTFLREGQPAALPPNADQLCWKQGGSFSKWGWRIGEYSQFRSWIRSQRQ